MPGEHETTAESLDTYTYVRSRLYITKVDSARIVQNFSRPLIIPVHNFIGSCFQTLHATS